MLAFLPGDVPSVSNSAIVPSEYESRTVIVSGLPMHLLLPQVNLLTIFLHQVDSARSSSQIYDAFLAALYAKCCPRVSGRATVIDMMGDSSSSSSSSSSSGEDARRSKYFDGEDRVMSES
jgi:hypothetical protein